MGPLIFMARRHQIKRKKSTLQYRLMQVSNQRQNIAAQMGQAEKQKALKQSLFNTVSQVAMSSQMNSIMKELNSHYKRIASATETSKGTQSGLPEETAKDCVFTLYNILQNNNNNGDLLNIFNSISDETNLGQLHMIDSQLEQEQISLENQLKLLDAEEQAVEKQMDQEIKNSAPKFGLSG